MHLGKDLDKNLTEPKMLLVWTIFKLIPFNVHSENVSPFEILTVRNVDPNVVCGGCIVALLLELSSLALKYSNISQLQ